MIKNKKGSVVIETIMLFPIFLYLIFFSGFKIISYLAFSDAYKEATLYARTMIVCDSAESAFNSLAQIIYNPNSTDDRFTKTNTSITSITVSRIDSANVQETVNFDLFGEGKHTFASFCTIEDGKYKFKYDNWNDINKKKFEAMWDKGILVEITLSRDLTTDTIKSLFDVKVYDFTKSETVTLKMGVDTSIVVSASNVISV